MTTQFDDLSTLLGRLAVPIGVSEAHGLLSGLLSAQPSQQAKRMWLGELLESSDLEPGSFGEKVDEIKALDAWFGQVLESLLDADLQFEPVLPADTSPLAQRLRSLGDFCAGFCYGVGLATAGRGNRALPDDTTEIIKDFNEIDSSTRDQIDQSDDATENLFAEIHEYVRVGVLLVHEELQPVKPSENKVH